MTDFKVEYEPDGEWIRVTVDRPLSLNETAMLISALNGALWRQTKLILRKLNLYPCTATRAFDI